MVDDFSAGILAYTKDGLLGLRFWFLIYPIIIFRVDHPPNDCIILSCDVTENP